MTDRDLALEYGELHDTDVCGLFIEGLPCCPRCYLEGVTEDEEAKRMCLLQRKPDLPQVRRNGSHLPGECNRGPG